MTHRKALNMLVIVVLAATAWSAINPHDYGTWFFELFIGASGIILMVVLRDRYPFTALFCFVAAFHYVVLAGGAKYTYAEMPLFNWIRDAFGLSRNYSDRLGHFMQGVTPALLIRELLIRVSRVPRGRMLALLCVSVALAFSGLYEILEWQWVAWFYPDQGPEWLGMQGDLWDAQGDMLMALLGAITAVLVLARVQDRQLDALPPLSSR